MTALMGWQDWERPLPVSSPLLPYLLGKFHLTFLASEASRGASSFSVFLGPPGSSHSFRIFELKTYIYFSTERKAKMTGMETSEVKTSAAAAHWGQDLQARSQG